jgi:hypothetical protein
MRRKWLLAFLVGLLASFCAVSATAQTEKTPTIGQYIISAKAGGVNSVEGKVTVMRRAGTSGLLLQGDEVQIGDRVTTGDDGMAEVLLNPGSFLRIGHNTSFEFGSTDLENLKVNLKAGSAIFEVIATEDFKVSVKLPQSEVQLTNSGVFRIDVLADGSGRLSVLKGKAFVGPGLTTQVAAGRTAAIVTGGVSVSKFSKSSIDDLDVWSKSRSKELASLNDHLQRNSLRNSLLGSFNNNGWNLYRSMGLWVFSPGRGWVFLPFGYGWSSPYGYEYGWDLYRCQMPWYIWNSYPPPASSGGVTSLPTRGDTKARRQREQTPPFQRVENTARAESRSNGGIRSADPTERRRGGDGSISGGSGGGSTRSSEPKSSPIPVYTPPIFFPAPPPVDTTRGGAKGKPGGR